MMAGEEMSNLDLIAVTCKVKVKHGHEKYYAYTYTCNT